MPELCDKCIEPGTCCRGMLVKGRKFPYLMPLKEVQKHIVEGTDPFNSEESFEKLPTFVPIRRVTFNMDKTGDLPITSAWMFGCTVLDENTGLCTAYKDRPDACRNYKEASSPLCIHYTGWREDYVK